MAAKADLMVIRTRLYDYVRIADEKKLVAMYHLLESDAEKHIEWWKDEQLLTEFDRRSKALETGEDKGFTLDELRTSIEKLRKVRYRK